MQVNMMLAGICKCDLSTVTSRVVQSSGIWGQIIRNGQISRQDWKAGHQYAGVRGGLDGALPGQFRRAEQAARTARKAGAVCAPRAVKQAI